MWKILNHRVWFWLLSLCNKSTITLHLGIGHLTAMDGATNVSLSPHSREMFSHETKIRLWFCRLEIGVLSCDKDTLNGTISKCPVICTDLKPCMLYWNIYLIFVMIYWTSNEASWWWSYGSWIYNYLYNPCLSPLMLWVRMPLMERCTSVSVNNKTDSHVIQ